MAVRQPRYSKEEFAQLGDRIYETQVRSKVEAGNQGKIAAIDIETGDFEVDLSEITACNRLEARHPDAQISLYLAWQPNFHRDGKNLGGRTQTVSLHPTPYTRHPIYAKRYRKKSEWWKGSRSSLTANSSTVSNNRASAPSGTSP